MYPFFLTELFFFDFYNIFLCLTPTTMYVHRRRTTPCNAYKKHENEKNNSLFWPKERLFCHSCTYNYWIMNEFWTWLDIFIDYIGQVGVNVRWYLCECFILWHHFWQVCVHIKSKTSSHPHPTLTQLWGTRFRITWLQRAEGGRMFSRFGAHKLAQNDVTI